MSVELDLTPVPGVDSPPAPGDHPLEPFNPLLASDELSRIASGYQTGDPNAPTPVPAPAPAADSPEVLLEREKNRALVAEQRLASIQPLLDLIENDEDVASLIESKARPGAPREQKIEPPKAPAKPANYNAVEAFSNPASESFTYQRAYEKYLEDRAMYAETLATRQEQSSKELLEQQKREREFNDYLMGVERYAMQKHGLTGEDARDFVKTFTSRDSYQLDNLIRFYKFLKATPPRPTPPAIPGGGTPPGAPKKMTPDDFFNATLVGAARDKKFTLG